MYLFILKRTFLQKKITNGFSQNLIYLSVLNRELRPRQNVGKNWIASREMYVLSTSLFNPRYSDSNVG